MTFWRPLMEQLRVWFDVPWRIVPAEPVLILFLWIAGWHVLLSPNNDVELELEGHFVNAGMTPTLRVAWNVLLLLAPVLTCIAWYLIRFKEGRWRVAGYWVRLGGSLGMSFVLSMFLTVRLHVLAELEVYSDSDLFSLITVSGVLAFIIVLVVRDIGTLTIMERVARILHEERDG